MKVKDLMSAPPQTCHPDADLGAVTMVMWNHDCGFVPVIDASGRMAGVITDRDICIATATAGSRIATVSRVTREDDRATGLHQQVPLRTGSRGPA